MRISIFYFGFVIFCFLFPNYTYTFRGCDLFRSIFTVYYYYREPTVKPVSPVSIPIADVIPVYSVVHTLLMVQVRTKVHASGTIDIILCVVDVIFYIIIKMSKVIKPFSKSSNHF